MDRSIKSSSRIPQLTRITRDPSIMGGKPCIRGMRVTVGMLMGLNPDAGKRGGDVLAQPLG